MQMRLLVLLLVCSLLGSEALQKRDVLRSNAARRRRGISVTSAEVYIGYMDEEQYYTAANVLKNKGNYQGVIVIERSSPTPLSGGAIPAGVVAADDKAFATTSKAVGRWLFQRPTCGTDIYPTSEAGVWAYVPQYDGKADSDKIPTWNYKTATWICGDPKKQDMSKDTAAFTGTLTKALQDGFNSQPFRQDLNKAWLSGKTYMFAKSKTVIDDKNAPAVIVYVFGDFVDNKKPLAVLIRTVEMGLNPSALRPYTLQEIKALKAAGVNSMSFYAIGAGGAAFATDCAGCINFVQASWFAGLEVVDTKASAEVAIDTVYDKAPVAILDPVQGNSDALLAGAKDRFEQFTTKVPDKATQQIQAFEDKAKGNAVIGMTYTYFGGGKSKDASNKVNGHSANMEDFHVIRIIEDLIADAGKTYPKLESSKQGVWRVDSDPFKTTEDDRNGLNTWLISDSAFPPQENVAGVLKWGLRGLKLASIDALTHPMCWDFVPWAEKQGGKGGKGDPTIWSRFIPVRDNLKCVLNPFYVELAVDFWDTASSIGKLIKDQEKQKKFDSALALAFKLKPHKGGKDETDFNLQITTLVSLTCEALWELHDIRADLQAKAGKEEVDKYNRLPKDTKHDRAKRCPLWSRKGWSVFSKQTKVEGADVPRLAVHYWKLDDEGVDRVFYKASNFPGIANMNTLLFSSPAGPAEWTNQKKLKEKTCKCT
jgi:hypothetical protein